MPLICRMVVALDLGELIEVLWEPRICPLNLGMDHSGVEHVHHRQGLAVNFTSAHNEAVGTLECRHCGFDRGKHLDALGRPVCLAGHHHVAPARQRTPERIKGLAAHDDGESARLFLKKFEVVGQVPQQIVAATNGAVQVVGNNRVQHQTATGAGMCGCESYPTNSTSS